MYCPGYLATAPNVKLKLASLGFSTPAVVTDVSIWDVAELETKVVLVYEKGVT